MIERRSMIDEVAELARQTGEAVMEIYRSDDFDVKTKQDNRESPVTRADEQAHRMLVAGLEEITPHVPVISEEADNLLPAEQRRELSRFWLVDPLDGTREFVNRRDEFTVNLGLINQGIPVAGVVHAPALSQTFWTDGRDLQTRGIDSNLGVSDRSSLDRARLITSRSHLSDDLQSLLEDLTVADLRRCGSSLKICLVAAGEVDVYCRFGPTWEWDTAAADAVLRMAGGRASNLNGDILRYNKEPIKNERGLLFTNDLLHEDMLDVLSERFDSAPSEPD